MPHQYQVIVGNLGTVYDGGDEVQAEETYAEYRDLSERGYGRVAHESVVLMEDGEPVRQHHPPEPL